MLKIVNSGDAGSFKEQFRICELTWKVVARLPLKAYPILHDTDKTWCLVTCQSAGLVLVLRIRNNSEQLHSSCRSARSEEAKSKAPIQ